MVLVFLQEYLREQCRAGDALVDRHGGHGGDENGGPAGRRQHGAVLQSPFLTDDLLDVQLAGLVLDLACHLLADFPVKRLVDAVGPYAHPLQYGEILQHAAYPALLTRGRLFLTGYLAYGLVARLFRLFLKVGVLVGEKVGEDGAVGLPLLRLAAEELTVQPCDLSRQLPDAGVEGVDLLLVVLGQCGDGGVERLYRLQQHFSFFHCPCLFNIVQRYGKYLEKRNLNRYKTLIITKL